MRNLVDRAQCRSIRRALSEALSPFQGFRFMGNDLYPGLRCASPWAIIFCPFRAIEERAPP